MAAWVRPGAAATQDLISKNVNGATDGYQLSLSDDAAANSQIVFVRFNQDTSGDTFRVNSTTQYPANGTTWIHVAATWDGTTIRLYYNGVQEVSLAFAGPIATNAIPLGLGAQVDGRRRRVALVQRRDGRRPRVRPGAQPRRDPGARPGRQHRARSAPASPSRTAQNTAG